MAGVNKELCATHC